MQVFVKFDCFANLSTVCPAMSLWLWSSLQMPMSIIKTPKSVCRIPQWRLWALSPCMCLDKQVSIWLFDGGRGQGMFLYYVQCTSEPELQGFFFLV